MCTYKLSQNSTELMALKVDAMRKQGHKLASFDIGSKDYLKDKLGNKD